MIRTLLITLLVVGLSACAGSRRDAAAESDSIQPEPADMTSDAQQWADSICATLSVREKAALLFIPAIFSSDDEWTLRLVKQYADSCLSGVLLLKGDSKGASAIASLLKQNTRVPPFVAIDAEWGLAMRLVDEPKFPANSEISPAADDLLMYDYGCEIARECRNIGINMVFGPVMDVCLPGSFMYRRSLGNDPHRVADMSIAYARGLESGNVVSVAKHFPGHGSVTADSHKRKGVIERSLNAMDSVDLYPFKRWVDEGLSAVMIGHLAVPSIDPDMRPAAVSPTVIGDLLRNDMGFKGLVVTDALNMKGAEGYTSVDAVLAGADIIVAPHDTFREIDRVVEAVESNLIPLSELDNHVRRILFYKYLLEEAPDIPQAADPHGGIVSDSSSHTSDSAALEIAKSLSGLQ